MPATRAAPRWMMWLFLICGILGILALAPAVITVQLDGVTPPPWFADRPGVLRLIFAAALAVQFVLIWVARDPRRFRALIPIGIVEKALAVALALLVPLGGGSLAGAGWAVPVVDGAMGLAFFVAWRRLGA